MIFDVSGGAQRGFGFDVKAYTNVPSPISLMGPRRFAAASLIMCATAQGLEQVRVVWVLWVMSRGGVQL